MLHTHNTIKLSWTKMSCFLFLSVFNKEGVLYGCGGCRVVGTFDRAGLSNESWIVQYFWNHSYWLSWSRRWGMHPEPTLWSADDPLYLLSHSSLTWLWYQSSHLVLKKLHKLISQNVSAFCPPQQAASTLHEVIYALFINWLCNYCWCALAGECSVVCFHGRECVCVGAMRGWRTIYSEQDIYGIQ